MAPALERLEDRRRVEFLAEGAGVNRGDVWMGGEEEFLGDEGYDSSSGGQEWEEEARFRFGKGIPLEDLPQVEGSMEGIPYPERMRNCMSFFKDYLHAKPAELALLEGYAPVFVREPERIHHVPKAGDKSNQAVHEAALLSAKEGIIEACTEDDIRFAGKSWLVDEGNNKTRWLWDGDHVNECTPSEHFKCETPEFVRDWLIESAYTFHFDNRKAFFHGRLLPEARKYFGVITRDSGGKLYYWRFCCWPMGF